MPNVDLLTLVADGELVKRDGSTIAGITTAALAALISGAGVTSGSVAPSSTPTTLGDIYIDDTALVVYVAVGTTDSGDWSLIANDSSHAAIEVGGSTPASTPDKVGDIYIDTTADVAYLATGTASSADWTSTAPGSIEVPHYQTHTFPATFTSTAGAEGIASAFRVPATGALVKAAIWCDIAPTSGVITVDLHKNGTTVFTGGTERPSIAISGTADESGVPSTTTMAVGDLFQFQVDVLHASDQGDVGRLFCMIHWTETVSV